MANINTLECTKDGCKNTGLPYYLHDTPAFRDKHAALPKVGTKVRIVKLGGTAYGGDVEGKVFDVWRHVYNHTNNKIGFTVKVKPKSSWDKATYKPIFPHRGDQYVVVGEITAAKVVVTGIDADETMQDFVKRGLSAQRAIDDLCRDTDWTYMFSVQVVETIDGWVGQVTTNVRGKTMIAYQSEPYDETKLTTDEQKGKSEDQIESAVKDKAQADATSAAKKAVRSLFANQAADTPAA